MRTILLAAALLSGCTVANGPRMKFAGASVSGKPVDQVTGCIAVKLSADQGVALKVSDLPDGKRLTTTVAVTGVNFVQQIVDVQQTGTQSHVAVQALQSKVPPGSPVQEPLAACL